MRDLLFAVLALIAAAAAAYEIWWVYLPQKATKGADVNHMPMYIGIACAIAAIVFGALFLANRVNKEEEIHVTE